AATIIGFAGIAGLIGVACVTRSVWLGVLCVFLLLNCWTALRTAFALTRQEKAPTHPGYACPSCKAAPHVGTYWLCPQCKKPFDTFGSNAACPDCRTSFTSTRCPVCGQSNPVADWIVPAGVPSSSPVG